MLNVTPHDRRGLRRQPLPLARHLHHGAESKWEQAEPLLLTHSWWLENLPFMEDLGGSLITNVIGSVEQLAMARNWEGHFSRYGVSSAALLCTTILHARKCL